MTNIHVGVVALVVAVVGGEGGLAKDRVCVVRLGLACWDKNLLSARVHSPDDPYFCPWDPKTQSQRERIITYDIACDLSGKPGHGTSSRAQA